MSNGKVPACMPGLVPSLVKWSVCGMLKPFPDRDSVGRHTLPKWP